MEGNSTAPVENLPVPSRPATSPKHRALNMAEETDGIDGSVVYYLSAGVLIGLALNDTRDIEHTTTQGGNF
jgi:hypothetical protein